MVLKRLEINGFKSFAQKTVFEFSAGIVGIVGPNGSGKSNVIDAVRWLLGEREAKNLRGGKIEDLIFAGTAKKARMSMAQVSLVFDNSLGTLPVDFKEVVITRKISRSGVSEYYINDAEVRLKDIIDFFSKIKLGTKGLTIIGQGSGDIFVKASPQERMSMVEEILGLREYQLKKAEASRKLKNTTLNLEKIAAMIQEVVPRLRMLKRQTSKWEKRFEIQQELQNLEENFFASKIRALLMEGHNSTKTLPEIESALVDMRHKEAEAERNLSSLEQSSSSITQMQEIQKQKRDLFVKKSALEKQLYKLEAEIERAEADNDEHIVSREEATKALKEIKELLGQSLKVPHDEQKNIISRVINRIDALFEIKPKENKKDNTQLIQQLEEIKELLIGIEKDIVEIETVEENISKGLESFNDNFKKAFAYTESIRSQVRTLEERRSKILFEKEKNTYKQEELFNYIRSLGGNHEHFVERAQSPTFQPELSLEVLDSMERSILRLRGELASIGDIDESLVKETTEVETHYNYLTKESADLEKASNDLYALIKELEGTIGDSFSKSFKKVNEEFNTFFRLMFGGGSAKMKLMHKVVAKQTHEEGEILSEEEVVESPEQVMGIDIELSIPQKKITSLEMLSGGEKSLASLAVLFALISVSPPPFLVLDEVDSALDEKNAKRFSDLIKNFAQHTQFIVVTHNRVTMEAAQVLYGITMDEGGGSKMLSLKLEDAK